MKRRIFIRAAALLLVFLTLPIIMPPPAQALTLGSSMYADEIVFNNGAALHSEIAWSATYNNRQTENYIEYRPNPDVTPIVAYGEKLYGRSTLNGTAEYLRGQGKQPIAAINGDFFNLNTGLPTGLVVTDGILRSSDSGLPALGINHDGSVFIGHAGVSAMLTDGFTQINIAQINKLRNTTGAFLYTSDFSGTTRTEVEGVDVVLDMVSAPLRIGTSIEAVIESVNVASKGAREIPAGKMILTASNSADTALVEALSMLVPGTAVTISLTAADQRFNYVESAVGGIEKLVSGGQLNSGLGTGAAPRTAVGAKADGSLILYTVDGRQSGYSTGLSLTELAARMLELGCVEALNLDGGGSTAVAATYPGEDSMRTLNKPSDGSLRACANFIFLVNNRPADYTPSHMFIYPHNTVMLAGASQSFTAKMTDSAYYPMAVSSPLSYSVSRQDGAGGNEGTVSQNGLFNAGGEGEYLVTGSAGAVSGSAKVKVIETPQSIIIVNAKTNAPVSSLSVEPGQQISLKALAYYNNLEIVVDNSCFIWETEGDIGTIDQDGNFTAGSVIGAVGTIRVSRGNIESVIDVSTGVLPDILETFENSVRINPVDSDGVKFSVNTAMDRVRYGYRSGRIDYNFDAMEKTEGTKSVLIPAAIPLSGSPSHLNTWVYGDNSGNTVNVQTSSGSEITLCTLDFTGWRMISAELTPNIAQISGIGVKNTGGTVSGTVYIDNMTATYGLFRDEEPPEIEDFRIDYYSGDSGGELVMSARVTDIMESRLSSENIRVMYDGKGISGIFDARTGTLVASIPDDATEMHRITIEAADESGNRSRMSMDLTPITDYPSPFSDMNGHWAANYVTYLYKHAIISGADGTSSFKPGEDMTRVDFAVAVINMLGVDISAYSSAQLPFEDMKDIPEQALGHVKAIYELGIINGRESGGKLYFAPQSPLSRAEAMTILGRILPRGYPDAALDYSDAADVPDWAAPFIKTMTGLKIVSGADNKIMPYKNVSRGEVAKILYMMK